MGGRVRVGWRVRVVGIHAVRVLIADLVLSVSLVSTTWNRYHLLDSGSWPEERCVCVCRWGATLLSIGHVHM